MSNFINDNNLIHYIKCDIDKFIIFKSSLGISAFTLIQNKHGLIFKIPFFNKLSKLNYQINEGRTSIIEYVINNNIAQYSSFIIHDDITDCYFQLTPIHLLSLI